MKTVTKQMVMHEHLNRRGFLFGGQMMSWMDIASAICASDIMKMDCVTVCCDRIEFLVPVELGDILTFEAEEAKRGRTSITIKVQVSRDDKGTKQIVAQSNFKFVAVDDNGIPSDTWNT
jgi:acyl-CoA hydrolase